MARVHLPWVPRSQLAEDAAESENLVYCVAIPAGAGLRLVGLSREAAVSCGVATCSQRFFLRSCYLLRCCGELLAVLVDGADALGRARD